MTSTALATITFGGAERAMIAWRELTERADMVDLRIFSYLPNPRIWKATIAARLCGVEVEIRGAPPKELADWLWDFDARPLSDADRASGAYARQARTGFAGKLHKTDAFLAAQPFGAVPAAFSPDGSVGIFESNSIMRTVARLGTQDSGLYGENAYATSRIDSFLDASLVFARDSQIYLLSLVDQTITRDIYERAADAFAAYMTGIENGLSPDRAFLVGDRITLADICFVCEFASLSRERLHQAVLASLAVEPVTASGAQSQFPRAMAHFEKLSTHEAFAPDLGPFLAKQKAGETADDRQVS